MTWPICCLRAPLTKRLDNDGPLYLAHRAGHYIERLRETRGYQNPSFLTPRPKILHVFSRKVSSMEMRDQAMKLLGTCFILTFSALLYGCGGGGENVPSISSSLGQAGAMATLSWDPVQDPSVNGYYVHYGKISTGQSGACSYEDSRFVSSPTATITNLDHNTRYYFAVSAYNGLESACSAEVSTVTPSSPV